MSGDVAPSARAAASFEPLYQRFLVRERVYSLQYSHIYTKRLAALRPLVLEAARRRWHAAGAWAPALGWHAQACR